MGGMEINMKRLLIRIVCCSMILALGLALVACDVTQEGLVGKLLALLNEVPSEAPQIGTIEQIGNGDINVESDTVRIPQTTPDVIDTAVIETEPATDPIVEMPTETFEDTTAEPELVESYVDVWDMDDGSHVPLMISDGYKGVGIVITVPENGYLLETRIGAPSYGDNLGSLTLKVYIWENDFDATVATDPVYMENYVDFMDNSELTTTFEANMIGAGRYLILICDGSDPQGEGVGVWAGKPYKADNMPEEYEKYQIESWIDGKQNKRNIGKFSLVIVEPDE